MKAAALRGALSDRARDGRVHVVEALVDRRHARRPRPRWPRSAGLTEPRRARWSCSSAATTLTWLSLRNVADVHLLAVDQLNTYDVLRLRRRGLHQGRLRRVRAPVRHAASPPRPSPTSSAS